MAISFTSITVTGANQNGQVEEYYVTVVIAGTYSAGGTVLTAAQKQQFAVDGKHIWIENDPANLLAVKYNTSTGAIQLYLASAAAGVAEAGAISGAGTYRVKVSSIGSTVGNPPLS